MMYLERKQEFSVYKYLRDLVDPRVVVTDEEPDETLETPTVAFELRNLLAYNLELGSIEDDRYSWCIICYANTKPERDLISRQIYDQLKECVIPVYDYDLGFNFVHGTSPVVELPTIGFLRPEMISRDLVRFPRDLTDKLRFRAEIKFQTIYEEN